MLRYFTSRGLSARFGINLARWKRWSRTFLPPDPLGGQQSGYARQFSIDQALRVYLGGMLLSELRFSVSESKQILDDLDSWLEAAGLYLNGEPDPDLIENQLGALRPCLMVIGYVGQSGSGQTELGYCVHGQSRAAPDKPAEYDGVCHNYQSFPIDERPFIESSASWVHLRVLNISNILKGFTASLGLDPRLYPEVLFSD